MSTEALKQAAAEAAVASVSSGMKIGLGTGSTAYFVVEVLARRMREGLSIVGVPTSEATDAHARSLGIPLSTLAEHPALDLTIDGADEIEPKTLNAIKGRGGALLREKIVAAASQRLILIADASKLVGSLGEKMPVPVEVVPFGWQSTSQRLAALGARVNLREGFTTDGGHLIFDCAFEAISDPGALARQLDATVGVVEHGLFLGMATEAFIATDRGVEHLRREGHASQRAAGAMILTEGAMTDQAANLDVLIRTSLANPVAIGLAKSLLEEAGIPFFSMDQSPAARQESGNVIGWWNVRIPHEREAEAREILVNLEQAK